MDYLLDVSQLDRTKSFLESRGCRTRRLETSEYGRRLTDWWCKSESMFIPMLHIKHKGAYGVENLPPTTFLDGVEMSRTTLVYLLNSGAERERETE